MGKKLKSYAEWRLEENMREYTFYERKFKRLLLSMFDWKNLPDGISERFIEEKLYYDGLVIFFKSKKLGFYMVGKAVPMGYNDYEEPTAYHVTTCSGHSEIVQSEDCVPIWNDYFRTGNVANVNFFAKKLSNIEKTVEVNLEQLKNPYIITCPEGQLETVKNLLAKKTNGEPYILASEDLRNNMKVSVFNLNVVDHTTDLQDTKHEYENEALTFFGINNVNVIKRERLVSGEASQNDEAIMLNRNAMFKSRREAVEKINTMFGLDIEVNISDMLFNEVAKIKGGADSE